jgi:hypothetical protein
LLRRSRRFGDAVATCETSLPVAEGAIASVLSLELDLSHRRDPAVYTVANAMERFPGFAS